MNIFRIVVLALLVAGALYVNQVVVPTIDPPFVPTPTATRDPESFVVEAQGLFEEGKISQAITSYEEAVRSNPNDATVYIALARAQIFAGDYASAQTNAENALLLNANNAMAHAMRAWALNNLEDYLQAEASIKNALELDPNSGIAHAYYAEILINQYFSDTGPFDALDRAIDESRTAIELAPNSLEAHRARGYVLYNTGNYEQAIQEYQAAIAINSNISDLYLNLGLAYRALGVYDQSVDAFTRANALNPSDPNPDLYTSRVYYTVGEFSKAVQYAEQAVNDAPADSFLRGNLGVMYYKNLQLEEALQTLGLVIGGGTLDDGTALEPIPISNNPRVIEFYFYYGLLLASRDRCAEAVPIFQNMLVVAPGDEIVNFNANYGLDQCTASIVEPAPPVEETVEAPVP